MNSLRLVPRDDEQPIARVNGQLVLPSEFIADILACAENLPERRYAINLCTTRYWFMVSFFAAIVRGQTNLLPSKRSESELQGLQARYLGSYRLTDKAATANTREAGADHWVGGVVANQGKANSPLIDSAACAAIAFTSGSTGTPQAHQKSWAMLSDFRQWHWRYLPGQTLIPRGMVATVPAWHMYGLEWAMLLPTVAPITVHCGADFFPGDLVRALNDFEQLDTILVTTPTHLRALLKAPKTTMPVLTTISATAPLDAELCNAVETQLDTHLFEIYGCSEIGSLAWRAPGTSPPSPSSSTQTSAIDQDNSWAFFSGLEVTPQPIPQPAHQQQASATSETELLVNCIHISDPVLLSDRFTITSNGRFRLLGRASDMVKVAGKRESLANLNNLLLSIEGVEDGLIYDPKHYDQPSNGRLAALVVAPNLSHQQLRSQLTKKIDAAFMPRPIRSIAELPRSATSKLSHQAVSQLLQNLLSPQ